MPVYVKPFSSLRLNFFLSLSRELQIKHCPETPPQKCMHGSSPYIVNTARTFTVRVFQTRAGRKDSAACVNEQICAMELSSS